MAVEASNNYNSLSFGLGYFKNGIERFHTDDRGEYENVESMEHSETTPHMPQHNPFSERFNWTFFDPVRTISEQAGLSVCYWEYAMDHVVYIKNRIAHRSLDCTPFEHLTGEKPSLKHVRVFGCAAFVYDHFMKSKVNARAIPAIMLGCNDYGVYTVERLTDRKIINSVHATFDETNFPAFELSDSSRSGEGSQVGSVDFSDSENSSSAF